MDTTSLHYCKVIHCEHHPRTVTSQFTLVITNVLWHHYSLASIHIIVCIFKVAVVPTTWRQGWRNSSSAIEELHHFFLHCLFVSSFLPPFHSFFLSLLFSSSSTSIAFSFILFWIPSLRGNSMAAGQSLAQRGHIVKTSLEADDCCGKGNYL